MSWTQPICLKCYATRYPGRATTGIVEAERESCCDCGEPTRDGIYFRADPRTVKFPAEENK